MDWSYFFSTTLPNWLVAIGTIGAVITSLWFSYKSNKIKAIGSANYLEKLRLPFGIILRDIILLKIINNSKVPFIIESIHLEFKSKNGKTAISLSTSDFKYIIRSLPIRLEFTEDFTIQIEKNELEKLLLEVPSCKSILFYAMTKLEDRIELKNDPQLYNFIKNWKKKLLETQSKSEDST